MHKKRKVKLRYISIKIKLRCVFYEIRRYGMIGNEITIQKRPKQRGSKQLKVSNDLQQ